MKIHLNLWHFQIVGWTLFLLLFTLYTTNVWDYPACGFVSAFTATAVYAILIYTHALWLFPRYFSRSNYGKYALLSVLVLGASILFRMSVNYSLREVLDNDFYNWTAKHFTFVLLTNFVAFVFGALICMARGYLKLRQKQKEMESDRCATELNLLKSQVQPHFLFNTLNNIYTLAHIKSDLTTTAIDRLAQVMRYFTEQAPMRRVPLNREIAFLENYIELELMRLPRPMHLKKTFPNSDLPVPPMLLMPFVENLFKHGVDKTRLENAAEIHLEITATTIRFRVANLWAEACCRENRAGIGLSNLEKRLKLHFDENFTLRCGRTADDWYEAFLEIPIESEIEVENVQEVEKMPAAARPVFSNSGEKLQPAFG